jgi:hypothetical protein
MKKSKKILLILSITAIVMIVFFPFIRSVVVMFAYSHYEEHTSLLADEEITINMPGGLSTIEKDWYPFVMTFNVDEGFSSYIGRELRISILYNFGAFEQLKGASSYYNPDSDFFNAFYGAYVIQDESKAFGYNSDGTPDYEEMALVPKYDMSVLVLKSIGCDEPTFEYTIDKAYHVEAFIGYSDWDVFEATLTTNSPVHELTTNYQAYIQYGKPPTAYFSGENFPIVNVKGKIYGRYFEEEGVSIFFYVIAPTEGAIKQCDESFLKTSVLTFDK